MNKNDAVYRVLANLFLLPFNLLIIPIATLWQVILFSKMRYCISNYFYCLYFHLTTTIGQIFFPQAGWYMWKGRQDYDVMYYFWFWNAPQQYPNGVWIKDDWMVREGNFSEQFGLQPFVGRKWDEYYSFYGIKPQNMGLPATPIRSIKARRIRVI